MFNMFSGGALEQMSIFALGIMPYISASIILQLLTVVVPTLEQLQKEGREGRRQINQYTRYGTIVLSLIQSFFIARWLESQQPRLRAVRPGRHRSGLELPPADHDLADHRDRVHHVARRADHRARHRQRHLADHLRRHRGRHARRRRAAVLARRRTGDIDGVRPGRRRPGHRRRSSRSSSSSNAASDGSPSSTPSGWSAGRCIGGQSTHLPLKINIAGVIPPIFASSILMFPAQIASFVQTPLDAAASPRRCTRATGATTSSTSGSSSSSATSTRRSPSTRSTSPTT